MRVCKRMKKTRGGQDKVWILRFHNIRTYGGQRDFI